MNRIRAGAVALLLFTVCTAGCALMPDDTELTIRALSITHYYGPAGQSDSALGRQQVMATGNLLTVNPVAPRDSQGRPYHHSQLAMVVMATSPTSNDRDATQKQFQWHVEQGHCRVELPGLGTLAVSEGAAFPESLGLPSGRQATVWLSAMPKSGPANATLRCELTRSGRTAGAMSPRGRSASFTIEFR
jgi:hypothetical protein